VSDLNSVHCSRKQSCHDLDPVHWIRSHANFNSSIQNNLIIGFHPTLLQKGVNFVRAYFEDASLSNDGVLGRGIYFVSNYKAAVKRAAVKGAVIICARLNLGIRTDVYDLSQVPRQHQEYQDFRSVYYHHPRGIFYDEFVVSHRDQIEDCALVAL
jgi:hypothetical protein